MLYKGSTPITSINVGNKNIGKVYKGNTLIWQKEKSLTSGLFGYRIKQSEPDPSNRVEYLTDCANAEATPCYMNFDTDTFEWGSWKNAFFIPKPCALTYDGTVDYYLDPTDFTKKADGTASDVSDMNYGGNFMMEFPTIYTKFYEEGDYLYVYISDTKRDDEFDCWSCKNDKSLYTKTFYLPMFEGTLDDDYKLRSIGTDTVPSSNTSGSRERHCALDNNGYGMKLCWNTTLWADELLMWLLFPLLFKSTNSQGTLGYGATYSSSSLTCKNNSSLTKGLMYGTREGSEYGITYLGLHNWWGHRYRRCNGLMLDNGKLFVKMTPTTIDGSTMAFNETGEGYIDTNHTINVASSTYSSSLTPIKNFALIPSGNGSDSTYYCDNCEFSLSKSRQAFLGGSFYTGNNGGIFALSLSSSESFSNISLGASISYHTNWYSQYM